MKALTSGLSQKFLWIGIGCAIIAGILEAQTPAARPQFEAVSIKPTAPGARGGGGQVLPGGKMVGRNVNLKYLMTVAYSVTNYQIFGSPELLEGQTYDVNAEAGGPVDTTQLRLMLQSALEDQFKLKVHRETRELPIYTLTVAKSGGKTGPGLVEDTSGDCAQAVTQQPPPNGASGPAVPCGNVNLNPGGRINGRRGRILQLVDRLSTILGRPVVDKTGLTGLYNITLTWTPDPTSPQPGPASASDPAGPSLFTAIQEQLGLKLDSVKGPVEVIVLDSATKPSQKR
jgi:uncharacterized protein (TIGR03435 family)